MRGQAVDRLALHQTLWSRSDRFGKVQILQGDLAKELGITNPTMSNIIKAMSEEGRLKKVAARKRNIGVYQIKDPADFEHVFQPEMVPGIEVERCKVCGELEKVGQHIPPPIL